MDAALPVSISQLRTALAAFPPPQLLDVRRPAAFAASPHVIPGAVRCPPESVAAAASRLEPWRPVIVYCVHGHDVGRAAAALLRERGFDARFLEGGYEAWRAAGGAMEPHRPPTRWVTRERPKIDRIACPCIRRHALADPALARLATIVRGADTAAPELAPQAPGLLAASLGLSRMFTDDHAMLRWGMLVYDALYAWCDGSAGEAHGWYPAALRATAA
ncbi:MAG: chromate resistance protein ChrB domain-containing protein [Casimicrobiaceae bacterium]